MWSTILKQKPFATATLAVLTLGFLMSCGLDEVNDPGAITGPAARGIQLKMTASPDTVTANGKDKSTIQGRVLGPNGQPVSGQQVLFTVAGSSDGTLNDNPISATAVTDGSGIARVTYKAPPRPDATATQVIQISGHVVDGDANGIWESSVGIKLISAEPRTFPPIPDNVAPTCEFSVRPATLIVDAFDVVSFFTAAHDDTGEIVRFEWFFGDTGNKNYDDAPDAAHVYKVAGSYTVTHAVTDSGGLQSTCTKTITVN